MSVEIGRVAVLCGDLGPDDHWLALDPH